MLVVAKVLAEGVVALVNMAGKAATATRLLAVKEDMATRIDVATTHATWSMEDGVQYVSLNVSA